MEYIGYGNNGQSVKEKILGMSFTYILLMIILAGIGTLTLYSGLTEVGHLGPASI